MSKVLFDPHWQTNRHEQMLRLLNGSVSKTIYGWLGAVNGFAPQDLNRDWSWGKDYDANAERGAIPDPGLLRQGSAGFLNFSWRWRRYYSFSS